MSDEETLGQDDWSTLQAELREAVQHQRAAYEQMLERQRELEAAVERARVLLERMRERAAE